MSLPREYNDFDDYDPSRKATAQLNAVLKGGETGGNGEEEIVVLDERLPLNQKLSEAVRAEAVQKPKLASVEEVRRGTRLIENTSDRSTVRLLIITKNTSMRALGSAAQKRLVELSKIFGELHVVILNQFTEATVSTVRLTDNVWLYSTDSDSWWKTGFDAYRMINKQLIFAGAFRADIIVSEDPFESGMVGYALAQKFDRPFEVHVLEDIYSEEFEESDAHHMLHTLIAPFTLKRADCIRVATESVKEEIAQAFPGQRASTEVLPRYHNLSAWRDAVPTFDLHARYPRFNFIMLHVSHMQTSSHTKEVVQGIAPLLRTYPTIGLVIVGNGPHRAALEKQVIALGIERQVEFEPVPDEIISHMKTSNVLLHLSEDETENVTLLQAAAVRLPILALNTDFSRTLFVDNVSAYLCPQPDPACVSQKMRLFLSDNMARISLADHAAEAVFQRIEQDYDAYLRAYKSSVERCAGGATQVA